MANYNISLKKTLAKIFQYNFMYGEIEMFSGTTLPSGWLLCDGSAISRTTYSKLFSTIGTTYGTGDGSTTFNLPNLDNRFPVGARASSYSATNLLDNSTSDAGQSHTTYLVCTFPFNAQLIEGQQYTIKAKINTSSQKKYIYFNHSDGSTGIGGMPITADGSGYYKLVFTATAAHASKTSGANGFGECWIYITSNGDNSYQYSATDSGTANVDWITITAGAQGIELGEQLGTHYGVVPNHSHTIPALTSGAMSANATHGHNLRQIADCLDKGSNKPRPMGRSYTDYAYGISFSSTALTHKHTMSAHNTGATGTTAAGLNMPPYVGLKFIIYAGV